MKTNILDTLLPEAGSFDFYQLLRLLERLGGASIQRPALGGETSTGRPLPRSSRRVKRARPKADAPGASGQQPAAVRIRPELNMDYPQADVVSAQRLEQGRGFEVLTTFMGLYGVSSPLPGFVSEELLDDEWEEQTAAREFIDILHYHLYPLLYQAWRKYRFSLNAVEDEAGHYWELLYSLMGMPADFRQDEELAASLLPYIGIFARQSKSQMGLQVLLGSVLRDMPYEIEPCIQRQVEIVAAQRCRLGQAQSTLGSDMVIGTRVSDRSGAFRVSIGPLDQQRYQQLYRQSPLISRLAEVIRRYLVQPLHFEIVIRLDPQQLKPLRLGDAASSCLGENSWLRGQDAAQTYQVRYQM